MADGKTIYAGDLPREVQQASLVEQDVCFVDTDDLSTIERKKIVEVLRRVLGNKTRAAEVLGIDRRKLYRLLEKYEIHDTEFAEFSS